MSEQAGSNDIKFFLSGGATNKNPFVSIGGVISNFFFGPLSNFYNNLWSDLSDRQIRYGFKDIRIIYLKNTHPTLTFKNARVYWNRSDNFTTMQIGRAPVNEVENSVSMVASLLPTSEAIPPSMWYTIAATDTFHTVQDFNNINRTFGFAIPFIPSYTKIGVGVENSSASISNHKIARMTFLLKRAGSAQGPVNCKIWDASGNEMTSLGSVDSSTLPPSGPGSQFQQFSFTNQTNQYKIQPDDVIGLEYPGAGIDENSGDRDDYILVGSWSWSGNTLNDSSDNIQNDILGTDVRYWSESKGQWLIENANQPLSGSGTSELIYKAETYGQEGGGGGSCVPDPGPDPGPGPTTGFQIIQDFSDINATTGYQVGNGAPNNIFRRAVKIDNTTATILSAPIARITFLMRRVGNPTGNVSCRIWNSTGTVIQTLGQVNVTGITNQAPQWTQIAFTLEENTYQMKVGDLIGVEFTTGNAQDHILLAGWNWQATAAIAAAAETTGSIAAANDKNGVRMIYGNSGNFHYDNEWEIPGSSSSMRWDFTNPPLNAEMTCYFQKTTPSSDTISCKIRGGKHTDSSPKDGCCYIPQFPTTGGTMQFQIECPHPDNHTCPTSGIDGTALSLDQWHGYKVAWWNNGTSSVHMEAWQDKGNNSGSTPTNQWEKVQVHDDSSGNCGNIDSPLFRPKGSTSQVTFRIDGNSGTNYKWLSIVEIQPGGDQQPPPDSGGPPGAKDVPGTSIQRWNGSVWASDDSGNSDLVFRAEKFILAPGEIPREEPVIIDPGTKRKPTDYSQGIVIPPLGPGDFKSLILERLYPPNLERNFDPNNHKGEEIEQQIIVEVDATIEQEQIQDPQIPPPTTVPPPTQPPPTQPPPPTGQLGPYASTGKQLGSTTRRATRHYASGAPDDETIEKNTKSIPYQHYQCIYYVTMHDVEHDDNVSVKYGGTHMGTGWFDNGISFQTGQTCLGKEENHPNTDLCVIEGPALGSILETRIGVCGVYRKPTNLCELWIRKPATAAWQKVLFANNIGGFNPNNSGDDEAQLRIDGFKDGSDPTIDVAIVQEIAPA